MHLSRIIVVPVAVLIIFLVIPCLAQKHGPDTFFADLSAWKQSATSHSELKKNRDLEYAKLYGKYGPRGPDYPKNSIYVQSSKKWLQRYKQLPSMREARNKCRKSFSVIRRAARRNDSTGRNYYNKLLQLKKKLQVELDSHSNKYQQLEKQANASLKSLNAAYVQKYTKNQRTSWALGNYYPPWYFKTLASQVYRVRVEAVYSSTMLGYLKQMLALFRNIKPGKTREIAPVENANVRRITRIDKSEMNDDTIIEEKVASFRLLDEKLKVYDFDKTGPLLKFRIGGTALEKSLHSIRMSFGMRVDGINELGAFGWPGSASAGKYNRITIAMGPATGVRWRRIGNTWEGSCSLFNVIAAWMSQEDPHAFLLYKNFNPDYDFKPGRLPGVLHFQISIKPYQLHMQSPQTSSTQTIDLTQNPKSVANFIFGSTIDLSKVTKLETARGKFASWSDYVSVVMLVSEPILGTVSKTSTMITGTIQLITGNFKGGLKTWGGFFSPTKLNIALAIPSMINIGKHWSADARLIRKVEDILRSMGYKPLPGIKVHGRRKKSIRSVQESGEKSSVSSPDKSFWCRLDPGINKKTYNDRLVLIDPAGFIHYVKWPANFHLCLPFFTICPLPDNVKLPVERYMYREMGADGNWGQDKPGRISPMPVICYPGQYRAVRVRIPPSEFTFQGNDGLPVKKKLNISCLIIKTPLKGKLLMSPGGVVDFGYEDPDNSNVFRKQYLAVWSGILLVKKYTGKVGIYSTNPNRKLINGPDIWCKGNDAEYAVNVTPGDGFRLAVNKGKVEVMDSNMKVIETVTAGVEQKFLGKTPVSKKTWDTGR